MNIQTVAENLRNTIKGKQAMLDGLKSTLDVRDPGARMALIATREFLEINIGELTKILTDVEQCVFDYDELKADLTEANGRVRQLERENLNMGWELNPDRMGQ
jgi:hypothetical protein